MLEWIRVTGTDGEHYEVPTRAHDAIAEAERESANVELDAYRQRIAELEAERDALRDALVPILYYFFEATSGEFWVESEAMLDKHGGRGTAQFKRDLHAAYDLLAEMLEDDDG